MLLWEVLLSGSVSLFNNAERLHETGTDFSIRHCLIISRYKNMIKETQRVRQIHGKQLETTNTEGCACVEVSEGENIQGRRK